MEFQRIIFLKKWTKSINRSRTIIYDLLENYDNHLIIPFRDKKNTIDDRKLSRNISQWCIDNNIEVQQIDVISYDDKTYNGLKIIFNY
jgi:hypothetical protein